MNDNTEPIKILLVEDNPGDARLAVEALEDSKIHNNLYHVEDGVEAMRLLRRDEAYAEVPLPDLILLDLNLPRKDGREVLEEIKDNPALKLIPVVVLTTSEAERDLFLRAWQLLVDRCPVLVEVRRARRCGLRHGASLSDRRLGVAE